MRELYEPASVFLTWVLSDEAPLEGSEQAEANLKRVIDLTADEDASNRDWATFILGNSDFDTPLIRAALIARTADPEKRVSAEALRGLARRDRQLALPLLQLALEAPSAMVNVFEAAAIVADASLVPALRKFTECASDDTMDDLIRDALSACEAGVPDERYY